MNAKDPMEAAIERDWARFWDDPSPPRCQALLASDTSHAAALSIAAHKPRMLENVFAFIADAGPYGATCEEAELMLGYRHSTASGRIRDLVLADRVYDSGARRPTSSKRMAVVWRARYSLPVALADEPKFWPETLAEFRLRLETGQPATMYDVRYPPGDVRRYGAALDPKESP